MTIPKIAIVGSSEEGIVSIRDHLQSIRKELGFLRTVEMAPASVRTGLTGDTTLVIYDTQDWAREAAQTIVEMRIVGFKGPVLVLSQSLPSEGFRALRVMNGVSFLEKPISATELVGFTRRMATGAGGARSFRRFLADCPAKIEFAGRVPQAITRMTSISKGGAFIEFATRAQIAVGDLLRLKVELDQQHRSYIVHSRVTRVAKTAFGGFGVGVQFIEAGLSTTG
jgi:DNA-binding response OmpR family regulator